MTQYKTFETERLILLPTLEEDATFIFELLNMPKWGEYIGDRNIKTVEDAKNYIKIKMLPQLNKLGYGNYTLIRKADNSKIGTCGLNDREGCDGVDIGFALLPDYEKKGYAFESAIKLINVAFNELGLNKINAITSRNNLTSQTLLEKLGLKLNGVTNLPGEKEEVLLYTIEK